MAEVGLVSWATQFAHPTFHLIHACGDGKLCVNTFTDCWVENENIRRARSAKHGKFS
jgi:hypothetical protein